MGRSRNERCKQEGTFLEHIKSLLLQLQDDVQEIKSRLQDVDRIPHSHLKTQDSLLCWFREPYHVDDSASNFSYDCNEEELLKWLIPSGSRHGYEHPWNVSALEFVPRETSRCEPLSRSALLRYRLACSTDTCMGEPTLPRARNLEADIDIEAENAAKFNELQYFWKPSVGTWLHSRILLNSCRRSDAEASTSLWTENGTRHYVRKLHDKHYEPGCTDTCRGEPTMPCARILEADTNIEDVNATQFNDSQYILKPSVGTWLHPRVLLNSGHPNGAEASTSPWNEKETGHYVQQLLAKYHDPGCLSEVEVYASLMRGIDDAVTMAPSSNVPWLYQLQGAAKQHWERKLRAETSCSACTVEHSAVNEVATQNDWDLNDQCWQDAAAARWWCDGHIVCYFCGDVNCEDVVGTCCERRRREILKIPDLEPRRRRTRARQKR